MKNPTKLNLKIYQGSTFNQVLRWESDKKIYCSIANISRTAPMVVTCDNHSVPTGWSVKITNSQGMKEANLLEGLQVSEVLENKLVFNNVNSTGFSNYTSGAVLEYYQPVDLAGYTAIMQIRPSVNSETVLDTLTTHNGKLVIDNQEKTISICLGATVTAEYQFKSGVYSLDLIKNDQVTTLNQGTIVVNKKVTR
jgi:hypothetical protein